MEVKIERFDHFGRGICTVDSKICFVENALPGEVVDIKIINDTKKYMEAVPVSFEIESKERIKPVCPYFGVCGGCSLQHMTFEAENQFKEDKVKDILSRYGNVSSDKVLPIVFHDEYSYRNKITLHGDGEKMGLYQNNSHEIVPIERCSLVLPKINESIPTIPLMEECVIKCSNDGESILTSKDDGCLLTSIGDVKYYQSISSFFQVNATLTKDLYDEVLHSIESIKPKNVLDLYCGTGTIGIYVSKYCDKITGIDYNSSNISDAKKNAELNSIRNIEFICDKVENQIENFKDIDFVIVDPPRSGLDPKTKKILKRLSPKNIVYVSCDVITLARDLKELSNNYNILSVKPFNMFPRTGHVESITVLERKNKK